ncbi:hypothetical protein F25303_14534, partial [Fusarium sp. NRRL 25303]
MMPVQSRQRHSNADCPVSGLETLETLAADFASFLTDIEALANGIKNNAEAPAISIEAFASAGKQLLERAEIAVEEAQAARQTSTNIIAYVLGKDRALKILPDASDNHICGTGNDISTSSVDKAGSAAERRLSSSNVDSVEVGRHTLR